MSDSRTVRDLASLRHHAYRAREAIVGMCANREGGHLGGSLSLVDILVVLYFAVLRGDPAAVLCGDPAAAGLNRDVLLLSKGHGALALYAVLAERGVLDPAELPGYATPGSRLMGHPVPAVPGVDMPAGSLGHGLALGNGFALAARHDRTARRCFVILGDGELQEGSVWEAAMAASALGLENLVAVVDRNGFQLTGGTEDTIALEPLADRWRGFGWPVREADGHDLISLLDAFDAVPFAAGRPSVIIAHTVKGRGLPFIEGRTESHYARLSERQRERATRVLRARAERETP